MLHCGNSFLKQVLDFRFKLDDIVPRYEKSIKSSFLGTVGITFFNHDVYLKPIYYTIILDG